MRGYLRTGLIVTAVAAVLAASAPGAVARDPGQPEDVTGTSRGRALAREAALRHAHLGVPTPAGSLRVWRVADGGYVVGRTLPDAFDSTTTEQQDGSVRLELRYDVGRKATGQATSERAAVAGAAIPTWAWREQGCFSRMGNAAGWLDSCYAIHKLVNETTSYDYYKLEQWGTLSARSLGKIYNGWLAASKGPGSSAMTWQDWSPRGSVEGACVNLTLQVQVLGASFSSPALFCEHNIPHKSQTAGSFRMEWSCGCIWPFGQPYPNSREIDYLQVVRVPNGGAARWTLSAGMHAR